MFLPTILVFLFVLLIFFVVLSVLVLVHEFGHFLAAKFFKVKVEEFALGLPFTKPLFSKKGKDKMIWAVYPVLFGGFVRLLGEEGDEERSNPASFVHKTPWARAAILLAGVTMNLVLGVVLLYMMLSLSSFKTFVPDFAKYNFHNALQAKRVIVTDVAKGSPSDLAGIKDGDILVSVDGQDINGSEGMMNVTKQKSGKSINIKLYHQIPINPRNVFAIPRANPPKGEGPMGIKIADVLEISYPAFSQKLISGFTLTYDMGVYTMKVLGTLISTSVATRTVDPIAKNLSGPVGIFNVIGSFLKIGGFEAFFNIVQLMALMTISLAIFNVLPFPALDGGRLLFVVIEGITGKKVKANWERHIHQIGMALLLALMLFVTFNDIVRIFIK
ncbi:site-2 protease family protein [Candidatus Gottesmanbacteria bacterium]|nr:site-2 protease family protein [Candidatus Gottesmanbacteria bacterium]